MLGIVLLYVGIVLFNNGIGRMTGIDKKALSVMNIFVGSLSVLLNIITIIGAQSTADYYSAGTGLLFGFTYLFTAANNLFELDTRPYGWYSLIVAIIAVPAGILCFMEQDYRMAVIWWAWSLLWLTGFIETVLKKDLGSFVSVLLLLEAVLTGLIPGFLMLIEKW